MGVRSCGTCTCERARVPTCVCACFWMVFMWMYNHNNYVAYKNQHTIAQNAMKAALCMSFIYKLVMCITI